MNYVMKNIDHLILLHIFKEIISSMENVLRILFNLLIHVIIHTRLAR